jgi:hypothetical protein
MTGYIALLPFNPLICEGGINNRRLTWTPHVSKYGVAAYEYGISAENNDNTVGLFFCGCWPKQESCAILTSSRPDMSSLHGCVIHHTCCIMTRFDDIASRITNYVVLEHETCRCTEGQTQAAYDIVPALCYELPFVLSGIVSTPIFRWFVVITLLYVLILFLFPTLLATIAFEPVTLWVL